MVIVDVDALVVVLSCSAVTELAGVGLAQRDRAGSVAVLDHDVVLIGHEISADERPQCGPHIRGADQVLHTVGNAGRQAGCSRRAMALLTAAAFPNASSGVGEQNACDSPSSTSSLLAVTLHRSRHGRQHRRSPTPPLFAARALDPPNAATSPPRAYATRPVMS